MTITRTFTANADRYVVRTSDDYRLDFLGGDDILVVRVGSTTAELGSGNDVVRVEGGNALIYGQGGSDRFDVYGTGTRIVGGADDDMFNIRGGGGHVFAGGTGNDRFNILADVSSERLHGGDGNDYFVGNSHTVTGRLYGDAGNDRFVGFGGAGLMLYGGTGNDTYRADPTSPAAIVELAGEGTDTVQITEGVNYTLPANVENLVVHRFALEGEGVSATGNALANHMRGSGNLDAIWGLGGNDRLYGGGSGDWIEGGGGADVFIYRSLGDAPYDPTYSMYEWIADFEPSDRFDLSAIDANALVAGHQHFRFSEETTSAAGTLHLEYDPAGWGWGFLIGHVDNDGVPDFLVGMAAAAPDSWPVITLDNLIL